MTTYKLVAAGIFASLVATCSHAADLTTPPAPAAVAPVQQDSIFDEARFGVLTSIDNPGWKEEDGVFITGMVFFDPWGHDEAEGLQKLIRPRIHVGGTVSTAGEANQVYAGFSWTADLTDRLFVELGFGGTVHDGDLDASDPGNSPKLGCNLLFHEYAAAGVRLTEAWSLIAHVEHSSHADLCDGPNNGLSRAGVMVGYKF